MTTKTTFSCGEALDIVHAIALHNRLQKSLSKSSTIELKADKVEKADTAGLQLMLSLSQEVQKTSGELIWKNPSPALIKAAHLLGLDKPLNLN
jgi:anti-anti-sigma factor